MTGCEGVDGQLWGRGWPAWVVWYMGWRGGPLRLVSLFGPAWRPSGLSLRASLSSQHTRWFGVGIIVIYECTLAVRELSCALCAQCPMRSQFYSRLQRGTFVCAASGVVAYGGSIQEDASADHTGSPAWLLDRTHPLSPAAAAAAACACRVVGACKSHYR